MLNNRNIREQNRPASDLRHVVILLFLGIFFCCKPLSAAPLALTLLSHTSTTAVELEKNAPYTNWLTQHPVLRVGVVATAHPPFQVNIDPKDFEGLTADYLAVLSSALGVKFHILQYPDRQAVVDALGSSDVDMITGDQPLAQANPSLSATKPYLEDHAVLVSQLPVASNDTLRGKTLVYIGDEKRRTALDKAYPRAKRVVQTDYYTAMASVANNENMVMWANYVTAEEINRRIYDNRLILSPDDVMPVQDLNFITRQDLPELAAAINAALDNISTQTHSRIAQTWGLSPATTEQRQTPVLTAEERNWIARHPVVQVLVVNTHIPLTYINDDGEESGYTISLLKKIGEQNGITFRWQALRNVTEMRAQLKKTPDSLIAAADASASEDADIIFSRPYQISNWVLVTRKNFPAVTSLADMQGKKVAVFTGSYYLPALREQFPQVEFVEDDFSLETALSLLTHRLDGAMVPQTAANFVLKSYLEDRFRIALTLPVQPLRLAMATSAGNAPLISVIDKTLREVPPRAMDAQLTGWQMRYALERFEIWGRYRTAIIFASAVVIVIALLLAFYFWRNRFLKRNLAMQQKLQNELEAAKRQVEKASESKSVFLSQMSHEIRTPMSALTGLLELENIGQSSPEQRRNNIAVAWESSKSLLMLVGDILDMAKIESGTFTVRSVPVSLKEMLNNVSTLFLHSAEEKGLTLQSQLDVQADRILFDPLMLKQIATNLLSNAIKFTAQGEVEIIVYQTKTVSDNQNEYVLEVCDSGPGLTAEQQTAIFEPFVQVGSARMAQHGTGLGLSICRQLAGLLSGTLEVESTPGEGTTFIFRFSAPPDAGTQAFSEQLVRKEAHNPLNILLVDDHAPNRLLLAQQLEFAGHHTVAAENGEQALRLWLADEPPFDMVITDCNMPGMSGFEMVRQLREHEKLTGRQPQPMFGLTAMAEKKVLELAARAGMTDCLFKPVDLARLFSCISLVERGENEPPVFMTLNKLAHSQPEAFRTLILAVIEKNQQDKAALKQAIVEEDFDEIHRIAHSLVGGARIIDASVLADVCQHIETAAQDQNLPRIISLASVCEERIAQLENQLRQVLHDTEKNQTVGK